MKARWSAKDNAAVRRWLPLIVGLAVGLRLALAFMHPIGLPTNVGPGVAATAAGEFEDSGDYVGGWGWQRWLMGRRVCGADGRTEGRMPGYPLLVAGIFAVTGDSVRAVLVVQALLGGGCVVMAYVLGRRVNLVVGLAAAGLAAVESSFGGIFGDGTFRGSLCGLVLIAGRFRGSDPDCRGGSGAVLDEVDRAWNFVGDRGVPAGGGALWNCAGGFLDCVSRMERFPEEGRRLGGRRVSGIGGRCCFADAVADPQLRALPQRILQAHVAGRDILIRGGLSGSGWRAEAGRDCASARNAGDG